MKKLIIDIDDADYERIMAYAKDHTDYQTTLRLYDAVKNGKVYETVTDFADRCKECGTRYIRKTVLEDIKAEIEQVILTDMGIDGAEHFDKGCRMCLSIIDRHISGWR